MPAPAYGHWDISCVGRFDPDAHLGFVYQITNHDSGKKYIGCKHLWKFSKGKRSRASEWRYYCSSSKYLIPDIKELGKKKFKFEILMLCNNKRNLYYNEMKLQVELGVLESEDYYNANIGGLRFYRPVKSYLSEELRKKLRGVNNSKYHGPFLITYHGGHQEWVDGVTVRQWCKDNGFNHQRLYELRNGKRDIYKGIVAMEYTDEADRHLS
tara:strand:- start:331 stop:963 length:633 start_codon:yes stop_codon:yes gene_type:complete